MTKQRGRQKINYIKISDGWYWFRDGNGVGIEHRFERVRNPRKSDKPDASPVVQVKETQYFSSLLAALKWASDRDAQNAEDLFEIVTRLERFKESLDQYFGERHA